MADTTGTINTGGVITFITDGAPHASLQAALRGILPQDIYETTFLLGDSSTADTIAASGSQDTAIWETGKIRRDHGTLVIITTGTGTANIDAILSRDGVNDEVTVTGTTLSLTGLAAGTHILSLDNSNLHYANFIKLDITEDGGANSITVKVFGMGRNG